MEDQPEITQEFAAPSSGGPEPTGWSTTGAYDDPAATPAEPLGAGHPPFGGGAPAGAAMPPTAEERPELMVGAAFAGGLVFAMLLKRLGS